MAGATTRNGGRGFAATTGLPDRLTYNVDSALDRKAEKPGGMSYNRDVDLLRYRCALMVADEEEQWPWEGHHEPLPEPPM
jgi:hypothetical protein